MRISIAGGIPAAPVATAVIVLALLIAGSAVGPGPGEALSAQRGSACGDGETEAGDASTNGLRSTVLCLINRARAQHGAKRVGHDPQLQRAAQRHARVMSELDCLASRCPGELRLQGRIRRAGYLEGARRWGYAENTGCAVSAEAMVAAWLESSFHRANALEPKFRDLGVGVVEQGPESHCERDLAVFSAVFAWRKA